MKVKELLTDESKWTKGAFARDSEGDAISWSDSNRAVCWCLTGAISKCYKYEKSHIIQKNVDEYTRAKYNQSMVAYNDYYMTTFDDIKRLVYELNI